MIEAPRGRLLLGIGIAAYLLFTLARFPAHLAARWFFPDEIQFSGASGSVWSGQADSVSMGELMFGATEWQFKPLTLLRARVGFDLEIQPHGGALKARVAVSPGGSLLLNDVAGVIPIAALGGSVPTGFVDGRLGVDLSNVTIVESWIVDASGTVDLVDLKITSPVVEALGNFQVVFSGASADSLDGQVSQTSGPLDATGKLVLQSNQQWQLDVAITPNSDASARLRQNLVLLGERDAQGRYVLAWNSEL